MKLSLVLLILMSFSTWSAEDFKSLSCSRSDRGTQVYYINGVFATEFGPESAEFTALKIEQALIESGKSRFDASGKVFVENIYNTSEPLALDIIQTIYQKIEETGEFPSSRRIAGFLFERGKSCLSSPVICASIALGVGALLAIQSYISNSDLDIMAKIVSQHLMDKYKVIVVSHSQGNLYSNKLYDRILSSGVSESILDKFYGNFQIGSAASSVRAKNRKLFTSKQDIVINGLRSSFSSTMKGNYQFIRDDGEPDRLKHTMSLTYLSPTVIFDGTKQGHGSVQRSAKQVFLDNLEELAWTLANNDENCCNGEDGRFYRADYESEPQGFVGNKVSVDKKVNLVVVNDSQICGDVSINANSSENTVVLDNSSLVNGISPVNINGDVYLDASTIMNENGIYVLALNNTYKDFPMLFEGSYVNGSSTINGPIVFEDASVVGVNLIQGEAVEPPGEEFTHFSHINAEISNQSNLSGFYHVGRNLDKSVVVGKIRVLDGVWRSTFIEPHSVSLDNVSVIDHVSVSGQVDPHTYLRGDIMGANQKGVILSPGSRVRSGSDVHGSVVFGPADFQGYWDGHLNYYGDSSYFKSGMISNSPIVQFPIPHYPNVISGAPHIDGASIYNTDIGGEPVVLGGTYHNCIMACNAYIVGETATGKTYPCNYTTGSKLEFDDSYQEIISQSTEAFEVLKSHSKEKILEVRERFDRFRARKI